MLSNKNGTSGERYAEILTLSLKNDINSELSHFFNHISKLMSHQALQIPFVSGTELTLSFWEIHYLSLLGGRRT